MNDFVPWIKQKNKKLLSYGFIVIHSFSNLSPGCSHSFCLFLNLKCVKKPLHTGFQEGASEEENSSPNYRKNSRTLSSHTTNFYSNVSVTDLSQGIKQVNEGRQTLSRSVYWGGPIRFHHMTIVGRHSFMTPAWIQLKFIHNNCGKIKQYSRIGKYRNY